MTELRFRPNSNSEKVCKMIYVESLSISEISRRLNIPVQNVEQLHRAILTRARRLGIRDLRVYFSRESDRTETTETIETEVHDRVESSESSSTTTEKKLPEDPDLELEFKTQYDKSKDDFIHIKVVVSSDFKIILDNVTIKDLDTTTYSYGNNTSKRYKVKSWLYSDLSYSERDIIFDKKLVDNKECEIKFTSLRQVESFMTNLRRCFEKVIYSSYKYLNLDNKYKVKLQKRQI